MGYFRDIHLFDENLPSPYLYEPNTSSKCVYNTLPFVDGHLWSTSDFNSGMFFVQFRSSGKTEVLKGDDVEVEEVGNNLSVEWNLDGYDARISVLFTESTMEVRLVSEGQFDWALEQRVALRKELPFKMISKDQVWAVSDSHTFEVECREGKFVSLKDSDDTRYGLFRILPENNCIVLNFK